MKLDETATCTTKSAFATFKGLYKFICNSFGLCIAPATFQRIMQKVLSGLEWQSYFVYLTDVLVAFETIDEHIQHLSEVLLCEESPVTPETKQASYSV